MRRGGVPTGADALVLLSVEELAVNRLRETFHRWVRTLALPVRGGELGEPLPHVPTHRLRGGQDARSPRETAFASELLADVEPDLKALLKRHREALTQSLRQQLQADGEAARAAEDERYRERQGALFDGEEQLSGIDRSIEEKQRELERRRHHSLQPSFEVISPERGRPALERSACRTVPCRLASRPRRVESFHGTAPIQGEGGTPSSRGEWPRNQVGSRASCPRSEPGNPIEGGTPSSRGVRLGLNEKAKRRIAASCRPSFQLARTWIQYCYCNQFPLSQIVPTSLLHLLSPFSVLKRLSPSHWVLP